MPAKLSNQMHLVYPVLASPSGAATVLQPMDRGYPQAETGGKLTEVSQNEHNPETQNGNNLTQLGMKWKVSRPKFKAQFRKTSLCKFHLAGACKKGNMCAFAHTNDELLERPDLTNTKLCRYQLNHGKCEDPNCKHAHHPDELRAFCTAKAFPLQASQQLNLMENEEYESYDEDGESTPRCEPQVQSFVPAEQLKSNNAEYSEQLKPKNPHLAGPCAPEEFFVVERQEVSDVEKARDAQLQTDPQNLQELIEVLSGIEPFDKKTSATIALGTDDNPLLFASSCFQELTHYHSSQVLGRNCRFLNEGVEMSTTNRFGIREAIATGKRFTAILNNRRQDDVYFLNLLDLLSLEIGIDVSGNPVRLLVGIQGNCNTHQALCFHLGKSNSLLRALLKRITALCLDPWCRSVFCKTLKLSQCYTRPYWVNRSTSEYLFRWPSPAPGQQMQLTDEQDNQEEECDDCESPWVQHDSFPHQYQISQRAPPRYVRNEAQMYANPAALWADMIDEPFPCQLPYIDGCEGN